MNYDVITETARSYYNSGDADTFYAEVWGGEDIHIGLYGSAHESVRDASRRTVDVMADRIADVVGPESMVLDIGAGYGGAARRLVERFGVSVVCLNLSEAENRRNRDLSAAAGMNEEIEVLDGSFDDIPRDDASVDVVWSQDAILHSGDRKRVFREVHRVLKPGGHFVFTDPMRADQARLEDLKDILARIHLTDLGSPGFYRSVAGELGWREVAFEDHTQQLVEHYSRVLRVTEKEEARLRGRVSETYLTRMKKGLQHWVEGGRAGALTWGIFHFVRP